MSITKIDLLMEAMQEDYMRNVFVDRLESARLAVDDPMFGDSAEMAQALGLFMGLTAESRTEEISRLRVLANTVNWANDASPEDIGALINTLRREKTKREEALAAQNQTETTEPTEPEPEGEGSGGE